MEVRVQKVTEVESIILVGTKSGEKTLTINKTQHGHSYDDFAEWDISDRNYYDLEELVDNVIKRMEGSSSLKVVYED